jgi:pyruvate dehydrogenase E2 component (dihydrolipoamide acetyltransferase)
MPHEIEIKVPDIGGASAVDVIELLVKVGDVITVDTSLVTLESDKASMEIPSPNAGTVQAIKLKIGDKVAEGDVILSLMVDDTAGKPASAPAPSLAPEVAPAPASIPEPTVKQPEPVMAPLITSVNSAVISAGPAVRRLARVLGVNLADVAGTGRKDRVTKANVESYVKQKLANAATGASSSFALPSAPTIDFSQFGHIEAKPLNKIKRLTGQNVHRSWLTIPHVTQFDEADITELEAFRQSENSKSDAIKLTILAFVCKVVARALEVFPLFNSSLDSTGEQLIYKHYVNIGIAVETPNGLVVPVIRQVNQLTVSQIAQEMGRLSKKAREKGLMPNDMTGGCFTISSLGGIGGTAFTPIVNSPEVAILGLSRSSIKPVYQDKQFAPRLMLPLSLSYDHRVIDGAEAARFTRYIAEVLADMRRILI